MTNLTTFIFIAVITNWTSIGTFTTCGQPILDKVNRLEQAIRETLEENSHLADGDNCTLFKLKQAFGGEK